MGEKGGAKNSVTKCDRARGHRFYCKPMVCPPLGVHIEVIFIFGQEFRGGTCGTGIKYDKTEYGPNPGSKAGTVDVNQLEG